MARDMGIGALGNGNLIMKKRNLWTFKVERSCNGKLQTVPESFVKTAARPSLSIEETEINFLNGKTYIPGKGTWETLSVTYYDVADLANTPLLNWLASVYNFTSNNLTQGSRKADYAGRGILTMFDGCGQPLDQWTLNDMWVQSINFGDLDYASSDEATIELTLRFGSAKYESLCPKFIPVSCCTPCGQ